MKEDGWRLIAVRGATTVDADTAAQIQERTSELLNEIIGRNSIAECDIVSIIFTATADVVSDFPAAAARSIGLSRVPLLCSQEIPVTGSVQRCIRVMLHCYSTLQPDEVRHPYLHEARQLRTDLPE
jgi:chorismate mutase